MGRGGSLLLSLKKRRRSDDTLLEETEKDGFRTNMGGKLTKVFHRKATPRSEKRKERNLWTSLSQRQLDRKESLRIHRKKTGKKRRPNRR